MLRCSEPPQVLMHTPLEFICVGALTYNLTLWGHRAGKVMNPVIAKELLKCTHFTWREHRRVSDLFKTIIAWLNLSSESSPLQRVLGLGRYSWGEENLSLPSPPSLLLQLSLVFLAMDCLPAFKSRLWDLSYSCSSAGDFLCSKLPVACWTESC